MKRIYDQKLIESHLNKYDIQSNFDTTNMVFELFSYEKGEIIAKPFHYIFFLVSGRIIIYSIFEHGEIVKIAAVNEPSILGDLEFAGRSDERNFYEAATECRLLALSLEKYGDVLRRDVRFLWTVINAINTKLWMFNPSMLSLGTYKERLLHYFELNFGEKTISGMNDIAADFHMSTRQLQRVLKEFVDEGTLTRIGQGKYKLNNNKTM